MIRLDAILITDLPQVSKTDVPEPYEVRVNCVLHCGQLSEHQELEVQVNGVHQVGVREGDQSVFTWQFFKASDEVRINLLRKGMKMRYWQGCWNEQDAILHAGTLPVQVFFNGKPQPLLETMRTPASSITLGNMSSALAETVNGNGYTGTIVLERNQDENHSKEGDEATNRMVIVQDMLVLAASDALKERDVALEVDQQEENERDVIEYEEDKWEEEKESDGIEEDNGGQSEEDTDIDEYDIEEDDVNQWEEEGVTTYGVGMESSDEVQQVDSREAVAPQTDTPGFVEGDETQQSTHMAGRRIVAFHASSLDQQQTLQSLRDLMAAMPPNTLIVDVRLPSKGRQKKRYQEQDGLSRWLLRSEFGAKYWDRAWAIQLFSQMISHPDRSGVSTWSYVVKNPESHPDGIPSLVKKLEEGYSIVVMDNITEYAESRRKAVIDELQQRVPALNVGPLG